ncbi:DNA methyltransferase [Paraburkholderia sp. BL10I2N1]|uniref:site-specific DNA-methyltransferase n=1 Tax=Paraburkholderia sp. BL10I2N1 TaxID=1938796 RepID=UPI0010E6B23A|nr:DNA methyltransferase [Paraburkholderia sp. BL10I2N1]TDN69257.1 adenine-specific DNA-methyltransferase [Paraburkholderia sp. BL10I2N1]
MSRLTDLIAQAKIKDQKLGADLDREFKVLSSRLPFGLNFERHRPEAVELPQCPVRKGDKVRILPARGTVKMGDQRLWQVKAIHKATKQADLVLLGVEAVETQTVALDDLVVVAEFSDTIHPGLVSTGKVKRGGDKPFHTVINGENYHVLNALTYTHRGKVDGIYIDPPYNTGAKDWKYNNDYVEGDDLYRHSKWLAMMERRLLIAKELLNPANSVLVVTIDEKEYLRLGLLLEQVFEGSRVQMVSITISPRSTSRANEFSRVDEYAFFVFVGNVEIGTGERSGDDAEVRWLYLRRTQRSLVRGSRPRQFYPVYVDRETMKIVRIGDPLSNGDRIEDIPVVRGATPVFPITPDGTALIWGLTGPSLQQAIDGGYVRVTPGNEHQPYTIAYLSTEDIKRVECGEYRVTGTRPDGSKIVMIPGGKAARPSTVWREAKHDAGAYGTSLLRSLLPGRTFPFPKSLYAVEDSLRLFVGNKPDAVVVDFFAGSGTTAHAVMRLNKQDRGRRQCISVTNNEVAADEQKALREQGLRPGDPEWEQHGICDFITKPRVEAAITGRTPDGQPIKGDYKFTDEFPTAEGFEENAEFFTLNYEISVSVSHNLAFGRIAPLLWLRAGARGQRIDKLPADGWAVVDAYGLLTDVDAATPFIKAVKAANTIRVAYIVTDDDRRYQAIARRLPDGVEPVRLYESYLTNFSFTHGD